LNEIDIGRRHRRQTGRHAVESGIGRGRIEIISERCFSAQRLDDVRARSITDNQQRYPLDLPGDELIAAHSASEGAMNGNVYVRSTDRIIEYLDNLLEAVHASSHHLCAFSDWTPR
jgi:hypothetical protein